MLISLLQAKWIFAVLMFDHKQCEHALNAAWIEGKTYFIIIALDKSLTVTAEVRLYLF
jgi:hypothetical protein